ncbi:hypothetical protein QR680_010544 [Steinernema hermaphroditum]|uniref:Uncharacterized protein n=1 Tax=Steinernema hermaphroditum TaxID=289476 RepID=A0AA39MC05_9BILA|nr:hypothetical protein QR680_010544 [Steinernema hermaphroditum]
MAFGQRNALRTLGQLNELEKKKRLLAKITKLKAQQQEAIEKRQKIEVESEALMEERQKVVKTYLRLKELQQTKYKVELKNAAKRRSSDVLHGSEEAQTRLGSNKKKRRM